MCFGRRGLIIIIIIVLSICGMLGFIVTVGAVTHAVTVDMHREVFCSVAVIGVLVYICAQLGIVGLIRESNSVMWFFVASMFVMCLVSLFICITGIMPYRVEEDSKVVVENAWKELLKGKPHNMQAIEVKYACCGKVGPQDYTENNIPESTSCFKNLQKEGGEKYQKGCLKEHSKEFGSLLLIFEAFYVSMIIFCILSLLISGFLLVQAY
ncbi:protein late bloomer-like [Teleopsis dalmanni]|uniref:protein late bloomer-like n=1 Tax=Teleopsis dalmanni TaxID=139649 RepID=UPI0018CF77EB|nr:protein late bloomer-like [Teleopsis dalmanni]